MPWFVFPYSELYPSLGHSGRQHSCSGIAGHLSWDTWRRNGLFHNHLQYLGYDFPSFLIYLHVVHVVTLLHNLHDGHWMVLSLCAKALWWKDEKPVLVSVQASVANVKMLLKDPVKEHFRICCLKIELASLLLLEMLLESWEGQGY